MIFTFFYITCVSSSSICPIFSFDADACLSIYGCGYCLEQSKCYPIESTETEIQACKDHGQMIYTATKELGRCFNTFSDDACSKCVSTSVFGNCGWCESLGVCLEGTDTHAFYANCKQEDWKFNKWTCSRSICASAKDIDHCRSPCRWNSFRQQCYMPRNVSMDVDTEEEAKLGRKVIYFQRFVYFLVVLFALYVAATIALAYWRFTRPLYVELDNLNSVNLDDLPIMEQRS
ncbi:hypothetical protein TVAGG3_0152290 [Trichomonas vaginalis G3]|uniref:hypothetical protein n=1 Tax=Trichomonas vaginalis (strain ATCC PRA-98 / G3) TaxID=412133 RepID=UPI0021E5F762|nr:hypothetical protein TVAGG3_0152290 [Trichomonas vaginalis G3]KAI5547359.1 hypothetical protein TVAGG3_0152290 [Trichomonas vaginalis G3]